MVTPPRSTRSNPAASISSYVGSSKKKTRPSRAARAIRWFGRWYTKSHRRCEKHRKSRDKVSPQTQGTKSPGCSAHLGGGHHPRVFETRVAVAHPCGISEGFRRGAQDAAEPWKADGALLPVFTAASGTGL